METPLFERPESSLELVALTDIQPWSASGAKSATGKSITALGLRGVVTLQQLAPGSRYRYRVIDGSRRLNKAREQGLEHVKAEVLPVEMDGAEAAALYGFTLRTKHELIACSRKSWSSERRCQDAG